MKNAHISKLTHVFFSSNFDNQPKNIKTFWVPKRFLQKKIKFLSKKKIGQVWTLIYFVKILALQVILITFIDIILL